MRLRSRDLAYRHRLTTYDAFHRALADGPRPTYGPDRAPDPVSLAAIGAYIARFREPALP